MERVVGTSTITSRKSSSTTATRPSIWRIRSSFGRVARTAACASGLAASRVASRLLVSTIFLSRSRSSANTSPTCSADVLALKSFCIFIETRLFAFRISSLIPSSSRDRSSDFFCFARISSDIFLVETISSSKVFFSSALSVSNFFNTSSFLVSAILALASLLSISAAAFARSCLEIFICSFFS